MAVSAPVLVLVEAPTSLGLRPLRAGHEPGAWKAPEALRAAGLISAVGAARSIRLPHPRYSDLPPPGSAIRNGPAIRHYSVQIADAVHALLAEGSFPLVVGGDCSVLLGCLFGARSAGAVGLIHIDGHSDFFHPGNYDVRSRLGAVAGMDLALATGRGEPLLTIWDGTTLVRDADVVQVGEREEQDADYAFADIAKTDILQIPVRRMLGGGLDSAIEATVARLGGPSRPDRVWLHLDVDVLDQAHMPAVDCPGSPGLDFDQLGHLVRTLRTRLPVIGADVTVFDPELDPTGILATRLVVMLSKAFGTALDA